MPGDTPDDGRSDEEPTVIRVEGVPHDGARPGRTVVPASAAVRRVGMAGGEDPTAEAGTERGTDPEPGFEAFLPDDAATEPTGAFLAGVTDDLRAELETEGAPSMHTAERVRTAATLHVGDARLEGAHGEAARRAAVVRQALRNAVPGGESRQAAAGHDGRLLDRIERLRDEPPAAGARQLAAELDGLAEAVDGVVTASEDRLTAGDGPALQGDGRPVEEATARLRTWMEKRGVDSVHDARRRLFDAGEASRHRSGAWEM